MATGTFGRSGMGSGIICIAGRTNPDSTPFAQVTLIESHPQHAPSTSPASAASRMSEVPLNPSMTVTGRPRTTLSRWGQADVELPGPKRSEFERSLGCVQIVQSFYAHFLGNDARVPI